MKRARRRGILAAAGLTLAAAAASTCGSDQPAETHPPGPEGGPDGSGGADAVDAPDDHPDGTGACGIPRPASIPEGWESWAGWGCPCNLWIPSTEAAMPPPIAWEPCAVETLPGIDCRQMKIDWPNDPKVAPIGKARFGLGTDGHPLLQFTRVAATGDEHAYLEQVVAEVDGGVRFALRRAGSPDECTMDAEGVREGRLVMRVYGDGTTSLYRTKVDGLVWGEIGQLPPKVGPTNDDDEIWSWRVSKDWMVKIVAPSLSAYLYPSDFSSATPLWEPWTDSDGLPMAGEDLEVIGRDVVFGVGNLNMAGIMAYDDTRGVHPLVRWYGDTSQGAGNVATDGKHIVWTHGTGKPPGEKPYPVLSIMAAPYTTNPAALEPKRLRSDPEGEVNGNQFAVGCGYAGHKGKDVVDLLLVRISDGASWIVPPSADYKWRWGQVLGFTCEEVFVTYGWKDAFVRVARIRLDSLGPGIPPD